MSNIDTNLIKVVIELTKMWVSGENFERFCTLQSLPSWDEEARFWIGSIEVCGYTLYINKQQVLANPYYIEFHINKEDCMNDNEAEFLSFSNTDSQFLIVEDYLSTAGYMKKLIIGNCYVEHEHNIENTKYNIDTVEDFFHYTLSSHYHGLSYEDILYFMSLRKMDRVRIAVYEDSWWPS